MESGIQDSHHFPTLGITLSFCSSTLLVGSRTAFKYLTQSYDLNLINFLCFAINVLSCLPICFIYVQKPDISFARKYDLQLIMQGITGSLAQIAGRLALSDLPISTVAMIFYCKLIFVMVIAHFAIKEKLKISKMSLAVIAMCGVCLDVRPDFIFHMNQTNGYNGKWYSYVFAFSQSLFSSFFYVFLRYLREIKFPIPLTIRAIFGLIFSGIGLAFVENWQYPDTAVSIVYMMISGLFLTAGGLLLVLAHKYLDAGSVSISQCSFELFMSFTAQVAIFNQNPHWLSYVGMMFVIFALIGLWILEIKAKRKSEHHPKPIHSSSYCK